MAIQETIADKGSVTFDDVAGMEEAKQTLREAIVMPLQFPHLFTGEYCFSTNVSGSVSVLTIQFCKHVLTHHQTFNKPFKNYLFRGKSHVDVGVFRVI